MGQKEYIMGVCGFSHISQSVKGIWGYFRGIIQVLRINMHNGTKQTSENFCMFVKFDDMPSTEPTL